MKILITGGSGFIGTNLIELLTSSGEADILNIDVKKPLLNSQKPFWKECSLLDKALLHELIADFAPDYCIHLAAETAIVKSEDVEKAYPVNTTGAENLFRILAELPLIRTLVISTQYVCGPSEKLPAKGDDYWPHTTYGESKVLTETHARNTLKPGSFIILRPTYIWGSYHYTNFMDLVKTLRRGRYVHPAGAPVIRSYGYVKNICQQMQEFLTTQVDRDWFYLGDPPRDSYDFVNNLSLQLTHKSVKRVPRFILRTLGLIGDILTIIPINSFRYKNMTTNYRVPMEPTFEVIQSRGATLEEATQEYAEWFRENG